MTHLPHSFRGRLALCFGGLSLLMLLSVGLAEFPGAGHLTISVGVACWRAADNSPSDLVKRADEALYAAKAAGRNQVALASA